MTIEAKRRVSVLIVLAAMACGCTTIRSTATQDRDGKKTLEQVVTVFAGGKLRDGMLDFRAEADSEAWAVESGTAGAGATSPNVLRDMAELLRVVAQMQALAAQRESTEEHTGGQSGSPLTLEVKPGELSGGG